MSNAVENANKINLDLQKLLNCSINPTNVFDLKDFLQENFEIKGSVILKLARARFSTWESVVDFLAENSVTIKSSSPYSKIQVSPTNRQKNPNSEWYKLGVQGFRHYYKPVFKERNYDEGIDNFENEVSNGFLNRGITFEYNWFEVNSEMITDVLDGIIDVITNEHIDLSAVAPLHTQIANYLTEAEKYNIHQKDDIDEWTAKLRSIEEK